MDKNELAVGKGAICCGRHKLSEPPKSNELPSEDADARQLTFHCYNAVRSK